MRTLRFINTLLTTICLLMFSLQAYGAASTSEAFMDCSAEGINNVAADIPSLAACGAPVTVTFSADITVDVADTIIVTFDIPAGFSYAGNVMNGTEISSSPVSIEVIKMSNTFFIK